MLPTHSHPPQEPSAVTMPSMSVAMSAMAPMLSRVQRRRLLCGSSRRSSTHTRPLSSIGSMRSHRCTHGGQKLAGIEDEKQASRIYETRSMIERKNNHNWFEKSQACAIGYRHGFFDATPFFPTTGDGMIFFLPNTLLTAFPTGTTVHLANHGDPQTLSTSLRGSNAFVTAYAVANSTTKRVPRLPLLFSSSPALASSSTSPSSIALIHPFLLKYLPNLSTPAVTHTPSAK